MPLPCRKSASTTTTTTKQTSKTNPNKKQNPEHKRPKSLYTQNSNNNNQKENLKKLSELRYYNPKYNGMLFSDRIYVSIMSNYDDLKAPLLTKKDEEYQMLMEVAEEYLHQEREKIAQKKSGVPTEVVIREHLLRRGFNLTFHPKIKLEGSNLKNDLFLLKSTTNPDQKEYSPIDVKVVIAIKNNAAANQSEIIKENFDELIKLSPDLRFVVIVLSEKKGSLHEVTNEKLGNNGYLSFTLVSRRIYPKVGGLYSPGAIMDLLKNKELKKTGYWEKLITYLRAA